MSVSRESLNKSGFTNIGRSVSRQIYKGQEDKFGD
ncbi:hypothetical protein SAMN06298226_1117 [Nitrosovibrio sp. Nv4]|nr:hypothetical protein SAMN06298226_1117 [Nitrosovibrio sp. Nv4]